MRELNVIEQVRNACESTVVKTAWRRGQNLAVHGCIYGLTDGRIRDLGVPQGTPEQFLGANAERAGKLSASCAALLAAREKDIASLTEARNSAPDNMWGQDYGT